MPSATVASSLVSNPIAAAATPEKTVTVSYGGKTITARMHPVTLRAPGFEVLLHKADGTLAPQTVGAERTWLGSVDGDTSARASGIVRSDGVFEGFVAFDRGSTWRFRDGTVYETRGLTPPAAFKWPSATDAALNVSTTPGQAGTTTYRFDLGFDLANDWFKDPGTINGSVDKALDAVEYTASSMLALYESNALLRPAIRRVVIRGDATKDPYSAGGTLDKAKAEWQTNQAAAGVDNVILQSNPSGGGGVAWVSTAGTTSGVSDNDGSGSNPIVIRHEVGHNWGAHDNHTNGPEGPTVNSGNQYDRFDGTELSAIFRYRASRQAATAPFTAEGTFAEPLPPYAALDLVDDLDATVPVSFLPTANDHDANADALSLTAVDATSHSGGTLTRSGNAVTYTPPAVSTQTVDWAQYVVSDATGKTATGVMLFRLNPYVAPPAANTWTSAQPVAGGTYEIRNLQSGFVAAAPVGATGTAQLVQRARGDQAAQFVMSPQGTGYALKNKATGLCADVEGSSTADNTRVLQYACHGGTNQTWRVANNPSGGTSFINASTGKCLAPLDGSLSIGAGLVQVTCGIARSQRWDLGTSPASEWPALSPATTNPYEIVNATSGLHAGIPAGSTGFANVILRTEGVGTRFTLMPTSDGTYMLKEQSQNGCIDDSAQSGTTIGIWYCTANGQQSWSVRQHPFGGVAFVNKGNGKCLGTEGDASTAGTRLYQLPCSTAATRRWTLAEVGGTTPPPPPPSYFENTTDYAIPDYNTTGVTSPITVDRTGNAPSTLKASVRILHPNSGDLVVSLIAPDGTVYVLQNRQGGTTDNIIKTFTVNASSEIAAGVWKLKVVDRARLRTGTIDSWSLQF
ncbi:MAG: RICIN domain-containing protein [Nocardiaceae bacterium]|nr:RICIN domain-containing protein [Nocardiaceae bacterium]